MRQLHFLGSNLLRMQRFTMRSCDRQLSQLLASSDSGYRQNHEKQYSSNEHKVSGFYPSLAIAAVLCVNAAEIEKLKEKPPMDGKPTRSLDKKEEKVVVAQADAWYSQNQSDKVYEFLRQYEEYSSAEVYWRLARAACDKAKHLEQKSKDRESLTYEALAYAQKAVAIDDNNGAAHRWLGVMLNYVGDYEGTKMKIQHSYDVRDHFKKAIQANSKDATALHCLGQWCYFIADMSWYTKKLASVLYATPPTSTFEEALQYFLQAEDVDPDFYSTNHLMIGKTYLKLNNKNKAVEHLIRARDLPVKSPDDKTAHAEAIELLERYS